ncbi:8982_t:CDS:2 [Cetraspora pellucida]|uniref:8982_t:CDS:1 n=1 Tax=Cetraspora pellucida TaxID=1433469 RepID=A0A9N9BG99_9GLOM|nr:8982_t:CDS:2 [Cetraspora pellucida]
MCKGKGLPKIEAKKELVKRVAIRMISKVKGKSVKNSNQYKNTWNKKSGNVLNILMHEKDELRSDINDGSFGVQKCVISDLQYIALEKFLEKTVQVMIEKVYKAKRFLNNALKSKNWDLIIRTQDVVATRVFMLRTDREEQATKIGNKPVMKTNFMGWSARKGASKEVVELPPATKIMVSGPSGQRDLVKIQYRGY